MGWILLIVFIIVYVLSPTFRCAIKNIRKTCLYGVKDLRAYIIHKDWNVAPYGQIICYIAQNSVSFGCGKTLSASEYLVSLYEKYDGLPVYDGERQKIVTQKIHIISNVDFKTIPYEKLVSLQQFVQETNEELKETDRVNDTLTVTYMLIDEASSQLNSRDFKSNFNGLFISRLLTTRHVRASIIMTSQRAGMIDKLMREVTNLYIGCNKLWRFQRQYYFDGYEIENAQNPTLVKPLKKTCWFITDKSFKNYDTFSSVQTLIKDVKDGKVLSDAEILNLQGQPDESNMDGVRNPSRWWRHRQQSKK